MEGEVARGRLGGLQSPTMRGKLGKSSLTLLIAACAVLAATASPAAAATFFESPSGNIGCVIGKGSGVRCDIRERDWSPPPKPAGCPVDWGNGLTVAKRGRGKFTCAGDTVFTTTARQLAYGDAIRRGRFRCVSRMSGMRCANRRNGHGFKLSRERADRF
jgi:hypothetical protein